MLLSHISRRRRPPSWQFVPAQCDDLILAQELLEKRFYNSDWSALAADVVLAVPQASVAEMLSWSRNLPTFQRAEALAAPLRTSLFISRNGRR